MEGNGLILSLVQASIGRRRPRQKNIESYRPRISQKHPKRVFIGDPCPRSSSSRPTEAWFGFCLFTAESFGTDKTTCKAPSLGDRGINYTRYKLYGIM